MLKLFGSSLSCAVFGRSDFPFFEMWLVEGGKGKETENKQKDMHEIYLQEYQFVTFSFNAIESMQPRRVKQILKTVWRRCFRSHRIRERRMTEQHQKIYITGPYGSFLAGGICKTRLVHGFHLRKLQRA